eukprot:767130-Hanusia_phi.AAC.5
MQEEEADIHGGGGGGEIERSIPFLAMSSFSGSSGAPLTPHSLTSGPGQTSAALLCLLSIPSLSLRPNSSLPSSTSTLPPFSVNFPSSFPTSSFPPLLLPSLSPLLLAALVTPHMPAGKPTQATGSLIVFEMG